MPTFSLLIILQEGVHYGIVRADLWVRGTKKYLPGIIKTTKDRFEGFAIKSFDIAKGNWFYIQSITSSC